jgi:hypothetical protein
MILMHTYQSSFVLNLIIFIFYILFIKNNYLKKLTCLFMLVSIDIHHLQESLMKKIVICGINGKEIDLYMFC